MSEFSLKVLALGQADIYVGQRRTGDILVTGNSQCEYVDIRHVRRHSWRLWDGPPYWCADHWYAGHDETEHFRR